MTGFCIYCVKESPVVKVITPDRFVTRGDVAFVYDRVSAHCPICKREVYVAAINDTNVAAREEAYRKAKLEFTRSDIEETEWIPLKIKAKLEENKED